MDSDSELKLFTLISQLLLGVQSTNWASDCESDPEWNMISLVFQIISFIKSMDLDAQPKPESKLMSLVSQTVSLFNSLDWDSLPKPLSKLISLISQKVSVDSDQKPKSDLKFKPLVDETLELKPDHEIVSLTRQIVSEVAISMNSELKTFTFLCPQVKGVFNAGGKFYELGEEFQQSNDLWNCFLGIFDEFRFKGEEAFTHFRCESCNGEHHKEYEKAPVEIKHALHPKHFLQLAFSFETIKRFKTRECYCCDDDLEKVFYFCSACDFAMNIACVDKPPVLSIPPPKWHDHTLALFPRRAFLTCNICALDDSSSSIYMCTPCDFVVHLKCINLPRVIKISRHLHRIWHTPSFTEGDWFCGVCRRKIDNDYGGYSCVSDSCLYAAHSRCATQSNVWDGIDLDGEPEEIVQEVDEPFVRISDGIIRHFSHNHHHLKLDENTYKEYDDNKLCQACITPIYFGNFYSCMQCEFVLHETCAHLSCKIYHPIHPHLLTLAIVRDVMDLFKCAACDRRLSTAGFFYECGKEECDFQLHVQCATISEPLVRRSHVHPLFLTSKPGEFRWCKLCESRGFGPTETTFNCIDECDDFALCFRCATLPQKLRYKHDKHILTLSYGEETETMTYWCEACEGKINLEEGFYMCDEYCCITQHVECLIGRDLYMKPGSSFFLATPHKNVEQVCVQSNNRQMSRPICTRCKKRCPDKIVFQYSGSIFCSLGCLNFFFII